MEENSDNEKFDAFEFNTDDEAVELVSEKFVDKFTSNPASLYLQPGKSFLQKPFFGGRGKFQFFKCL